MFDNIYCLPHATSETTAALVDGAEVRYLFAFHAANDGSISSVACSVIHAGDSRPVGFSVTDHR